MLYDPPSVFGTIILMLGRIVICIILFKIFYNVLFKIVSVIYKKISLNSKSPSIQAYHSKMKRISYFTVIPIIIITSLISSQGMEHNYINRIGYAHIVANLKNQDNEGIIAQLEGKYTINTKELRVLKKYKLTSKNKKYENQRRSIINDAENDEINF